LATFLAVEESRLTVRHADGPGCYGHNAADDAAALAAVAARAVPGCPVRFQFSVEDEFAWEPYGSAMLADLEASLDQSGHIIGWRHRTLTDTHSARPRGQGNALFPSWLRQAALPRPWAGPGEGGARNIVPLYDLPAVEAIADHVRTPLRTSSLRSLGAFFNVFAIESFMDELAEVAGRDPLAFRLQHLPDDRARAVLETAAEIAGWTPHVGPSGRGQGLALARYKGDKAYVAQVVDAEIDPDSGQTRVHRVVVVCDAGVVVNPDGLRNQLEGGTIQGLSRALHEELIVDGRGIHSRNWPTYPVLRFGQVPEVDVVLLDRSAYPPLGAGEAATPPAPAALANAIDDQIGVRLRTLPFTPERARQRLMDMSEEEVGRVLL
jgi:nicotinate dehydrogenase subunit B